MYIAPQSRCRFTLGKDLDFGVALNEGVHKMGAGTLRYAMCPGVAPITRVATLIVSAVIPAGQLVD